MFDSSTLHLFEAGMRLAGTLRVVERNLGFRAPVGMPIPAGILVSPLVKIHRAYKTELDPNDKQRTAFLRAAGAARWAYNWGLRRKMDAYEARKAALAAGVPKAEAPKVPTAIDLHKELVELKKVPQAEGGVPWMYESSKAAPEEALRNLDKAFEGFFRRCKAGKPGSKGFPQFKSRKNGVGGFRLVKARATETHAILPRVGPVKLKERGYLPTRETEGVRVLGTAVSEKTGRWFVSMQVEQELPDPSDLSGLPVIGVDVGIKTLATCSDGVAYENPKALRAGTIKLKRLQRSVSRKVKGSNNREKAKARVARQHVRISNIRKDALHKCSSAITKRASVVVLEDLNVAGMMKNHRLAGAMADAAVGELHRQIRYKAAWRGAQVLTADRWFPSSKTCSCCGHVKAELSLSERLFRCEKCGMTMDRDLNASANLKNLAARLAATACGEVSSGRVGDDSVKLASMKQEPNSGRGLSLPGSV